MSADAIKARRLSAESVAALRHIQVHGACTAGEMMKAGHARVTLNSVAACGYVAPDRTQKEVRLVLTRKARGLLDGPIVLRAAHPKRIAAGKERAALEASVITGPLMNDGLRPGCMVAFALPSRWGNTLRYPDGRVTDMAGNPFPSQPSKE